MPTAAAVHCPEHATGTLRQVGYRLTCTADPTCEPTWTDLHTHGDGECILVNADGHLFIPTPA